MIAREQRYSASDPCPICGGTANDRRGRGMRCYGFRSDDGRYGYCSREERAGNAPAGPHNTFRHWLGPGDCRCGGDHLASGEDAHAVKRPELRLVPRAPKPATQAHRLDEPTAIYLYRALETGAPLRKLRYGTGKGKRFVWQHIDRIGDLLDWIDGRAEMVPDAYCAEMVPESDPFAPLFIAEGEKDAEKGGERGGLFISPPDGTGSWCDRYNRLAAGRQVIVLVDADEAGRRHAEQVAQSIADAGIATTVRIISFEDAHDVGDWFDAGHSLAELHRLAAAAPIISAHTPQSGNSNRAMQDERTAQSQNSACPRCAQVAEQLRIAEQTIVNLRRERAIENEYLRLPTAKASAPLKLAGLALHREISAPTRIHPHDDAGRMQAYRAAVAETLGVKDAAAGRYLRDLGEIGILDYRRDSRDFTDQKIFIAPGPHFDAPLGVADATRGNGWGGKRVKGCPHCRATDLEHYAVCRGCGARLRPDELIDIVVAAEAEAEAECGEGALEPSGEMPQTEDSNRAMQDARDSLPSRESAEAPNVFLPLADLQRDHVASAGTDAHGDAVSSSPRPWECSTIVAALLQRGMQFAEVRLLTEPTPIHAAAVAVTQAAIPLTEQKGA